MVGERQGSVNDVSHFWTRKVEDRRKNSGAQTEGCLRRRESSSEWITTPERMAASRVDRSQEGQELDGMASEEEGVPRLISRVRDLRLCWGVEGGRLLPAAGHGRRARSLWRDKMAFLASWDTLGSFGEDVRERDQTHSGQMGPPAKKLEW